MILKIAIQMDDLSCLNHDNDNTLLLAKEALSRGNKLFYYQAQKLSYRDGIINAQGNSLEISNGTIIPGAELTKNLDEMDVILMRQNPPFDINYITPTYFLEQLMPEVMVINNPASVRNFPEKIFPTLLESYMPPTLISADIEEIRKFHQDFPDMVIKPLYGYGGFGILHIKADDDNFHALLEMMFAKDKTPIVAQRFLPEVTSEDRRIIMLDGKISATIGRIPAPDNIRANLRAGGLATAAILSQKQKSICEEIGEILHDQGIIFAGIDLIGDYLSEINITSPTGMMVANSIYGINLEKQFWNIVENYLESTS